VSSCSGDVETYINREDFFRPNNSPEVLADYSNELEERLEINHPEGDYYIHVRAIKRSALFKKMMYQIIIQAMN